jgi:hypothetical protein
MHMYYCGPGDLVWEYIEQISIKCF